MAGLKWEREEVILTMALYFEERPRIAIKKDAPVVALSKLLRSMRPDHARNDVGYRSLSSVTMKISNLASLDLLHTAEGRAGLPTTSKMDKAVWTEFVDAPERLRTEAAAIQAMLHAGATYEETNADRQDTNPAVEGRLRTVLHNRRDRDPKLARQRKLAALKRDGALKCEACGFDATARFGDLAGQVIECHHIKPLSEMAEPAPVALNDLALLCANCHRALHAARPWLTLEQLRARVALQQRTEDGSDSSSLADIAGSDADIENLIPSVD